MVAAAVGIAGTAYGAYEAHQNSGGGGGGGGAGASTYVPTGQGGADQSWQQIMQQLMSASGGQANMLIPFLNSAFGNTGNMYSQLAGRMGNYGSALERTANTSLGAQTDLERAGSTLWNTALDPENALHDRTQQRVVDASRAASSARGIGMGGESAGMESGAVSNFNLDWNDRQLGRESTGLQGLTGAYDAAGRQGLAGMSELAGAAGMFEGAGKLPFELADMYSGSMASGVYDPMRNIMENIQSYLGLGQSATAQSFGQGQTNLNNITSGLQTLGNNWGTISQFFGTPADSSGSGASSTVDSTGWGGA